MTGVREELQANKRPADGRVQSNELNSQNQQCWKQTSAASTKVGDFRATTSIRPSAAVPEGAYTPKRA